MSQNEKAIGGQVRDRSGDGLSRGEPGKGPFSQKSGDRLEKGLSFIQNAVSLSRLMRENAREGRFGEIAGQMKEREALLSGVAGLLDGLGPSAAMDGPTVSVWMRLLPVLEEFSRENDLLIQVLKEKRGGVVRNIAAAEARRRISRYVV